MTGYTQMTRHDLIYFIFSICYCGFGKGISESGDFCWRLLVSVWLRAIYGLFLGRFGVYFFPLLIFSSQSSHSPRPLLSHSLSLETLESLGLRLNEPCLDYLVRDKICCMQGPAGAGWLYIDPQNKACIQKGYIKARILVQLPVSDEVLLFLA